MRLLVSLKVWTDDALSVLRRCPQISGVVVGHPLCRKLGSPGGWVNAPRFAEMAKNVGFEVALQLPAFITSRNMCELETIIRIMRSAGSLDHLFLSDMGILSTIGHRDSLRVVWDRYGFGRSHFPNRPFLEFLKANGVSGVELLDTTYRNHVTDNGLDTYISTYGPEAMSLARVCYQEYLLSRRCDGTNCLCAEPTVVQCETGFMPLFADGHTLTSPEKHDVTYRVRQEVQDEPVTVIMHALDSEELLEKIKGISGIEEAGSSIPATGEG